MADILIAAGSSMQPAPAGQVVLFIDTENNNILSYIDSAGVIKIYNSGDTSELEECCSCVIAKQWTDRVTCALQSGTLDATEFGLIMSQGLSVVTTETTNPDTGTKTCNVEIGPKNSGSALPQAIQSNPASIVEFAVSATKQLFWFVFPISASQLVTFTSSNIAKATVNSNGLVTAVSTGTCTITISSVVNPSISVVVNVNIIP